jgi:hypothetical protein
MACGVELNVSSCFWVSYHWSRRHKIRKITISDITRWQFGVIGGGFLGILLINQEIFTIMTSISDVYIRLWLLVMECKMREKTFVYLTVLFGV